MKILNIIAAGRAFLYGVVENRDFELFYVLANSHSKFKKVPKQL